MGSSRPTAIVISDFPIIRKTVHDVLGEQYATRSVTWDGFLAETLDGLDLIIVDTTWVPTETALEFLRTRAEAARIAVCSLDQNEIEIYRRGNGGLDLEARLPSLLELSA